MEALLKLLDKLSEYELWNNILPGVAICIILKCLVKIDLLSGNAVEQFFIFYLIGLVNGRIGSLIVEPILKRITPFREYPLFIEAVKNDPKIEKYSTLNNQYRAMTSVSLISFVMYLALGVQYDKNWTKGIIPAIILLALVILFACSFCKQTKYIVRRIDKALEKK